MLSTIKGFYDNGKITFAEEPPVKTKAEVIINLSSINNLRKKL